VRIRIVSTFPGKHTVQVVSKRYGRLIIHKHIGSFATDSEKQRLLAKAMDFIREETRQTSLFDKPFGFKMTDIIISESKPLFAYRLLGAIYDKLGFSRYPDGLIRDLVIARIYAPSSKRETQEILNDLFNRKHALVTVYRHLKKSLSTGLKDSFQKALISFAKDGLGDTLRLVFYDVTTLYFDSQVKEGLKDFGFSKDHHFRDIQIVVGLVVNKQGFPLYFDVFNGRTFEGNTFISVIQNIQRILNKPDLVVIADAAMISKANVEKLIEKNIGFIVGARLANLPTDLQEEIFGGLSKQDGKIITVTYRKERLVCQYLAERATKDRSDRERQLVRAQKAIQTPGKITNRFRFLKKDGGKYSLNEGLMVKAEKLEGIKGYLTNTSLNEETVISRYHDLWRIENAFRMTKSDLEARPIFHRLDETITSHLVIVFAGLAICRYLEIKTEMSIQKILKLAGKVLTHEVINANTGETVFIETTVKDPKLREKIDLLKSLGH
jgi:transposase